MLQFNNIMKQDKARQMRLTTRAKFRRINSLDLIPEDPKQEEIQAALLYETNLDTTEKSVTTETLEKYTFMTRFINLIMQFTINLFMGLIRSLLCIPLSIAAPSFWLSALLWVFWKVTRVPLTCLRWMFCYDAMLAESMNTNKRVRTVLISGGSTLQALQLARNLYTSGARVIVCEYEGLFFLSRFSSAVDKFYVVPRPKRDNIDNYIAALCRIVQREKATVYVPVCANSSAYYDSLAKPHLELLGCASFIPSLQETLILDDCQKFFEKCASQQIELPAHQVLSASNDLMNSYDSGFIGNFRNLLIAVGKQGLLERQKYVLPNNKNHLNFNQPINEQHQWLLVRDVPGDHFITATTVKESRVLSNVSCRIEAQTNNLLFVDKQDIDERIILNWLKIFFGKIRFQRQVNGHISFRLVKCQSSGKILPLGIQIGVTLPYISHNPSHTQILSRTLKCGHIINRRQTLNDSNSEKAHLVLDKREALFTYWDPLPYCAYYHFQLPLSSVKSFLQQKNRNNHHKNQQPRLEIDMRNNATA